MTRPPKDLRAVIAQHVKEGIDRGIPGLRSQVRKQIATEISKAILSSLELTDRDFRALERERDAAIRQARENAEDMKKLVAGLQAKLTEIVKGLETHG